MRGISGSYFKRAGCWHGGTVHWFRNLMWNISSAGD